LFGAKKSSPGVSAILFAWLGMVNGQSGRDSAAFSGSKIQDWLVEGQAAKTWRCPRQNRGKMRKRGLECITIVVFVVTMRIALPLFRKCLLGH